MKIACDQIYQEIVSETKEKLEKVLRTDQPPRMVIFSANNDELTQVFLSEKKRLAESLGIECQIVTYARTPLFQQFAMDIRAAANSKKTHAVIIQRPLPPELSSPTLENFIPIVKEVEGQKYKSPYQPPVGLTTLSLLKYLTTDGKEWRIKPKDTEFFKRNYKKKFIVLAGRGKTTGQPIATTLVKYKLAMVITHSQTPTPENFYRQADILITTTGKPIINAESIKPGCTLINFGYHKSCGKTMGDYSEPEIESIAGYYSPILRGTGPLSLAYLMRNVVEAYSKQVK